MSDNEIVRVLRVYEFVGPRVWVELTVERSIHGTKEVGPGRFIRGATIGDYPELFVDSATAADKPQEVVNE